MINDFKIKLNKQVGARVVEIKQLDSSTLKLILSNKVEIEFTFWRLLGGEHLISSFDFDGKNLLIPLGNSEILSELILKNIIKNILFVDSCGDIEIHFENNKVLQIFNFTGNEVWEVTFSDGTGELSNYIFKK